MVINHATLREAFSSFNTIFNKAFEEAEVRYQKVAMEVSSVSKDETYAWLGVLPSMREWIGNREIHNLTTYGYTIANKDFELTVSVPRNDIEDDNIGIYKPMLQDLAYSAKQNPDKLVFSLFPRGFSEKCFDGTPFFGDSHPCNQKLAQSNKGTYKLTPDTYGMARTQMMTLVNTRNESLYIVPDLSVVAPQKEAVARSIVMADTIHQEVNIYKGTADLLVVPELARNPEQWFLLSTKRPVMPFIFQSRRKPELVAKNSTRDENVFWEKVFVYGVDSRCNAGYGLWQLAFGSTGEADAPNEANVSNENGG